MLRKTLLAISCILMQTDYSHSAAAAASGARADRETNVLSRKVLPRAPAAMHHEEIDATIRSQPGWSFSCAPLSEEGEELLLGPSGWEDFQGHPYFYDPEKDEDPKRVRFPDQEKILAKVPFSQTVEGLVWSVKYDLGSGLDKLRYFLLCQKDHTVVELPVESYEKPIDFLNRQLYVATFWPHDTKKPDLVLRFGPEADIPYCFKLGKYPRDLLNFMLYEETEEFIFIGFPSFKENPAVFHVIGKEHHTHDIVKRDGIHDFSWFGGIQNSLFVSHKDPTTGIMSLSVIGALKPLVDTLSLPPSIGAWVPTAHKIHFRHQDGESRGVTRVNIITGETEHITGETSGRAISLGFSTERVFVPSRSGNPIEVIMQYAGDSRISRKTILAVHGGPVFEETGEFTEPVHATRLANFNYVTLNYSGSSGSIELFLRGKGQYGNGILEEIFDVARWLRGTESVENLGISGSSYGGYSVLLAAASEEGQSLFDYGLASVPLVDIKDVLSEKMHSFVNNPNMLLMGLSADMPEAEYISRVEVLERSSSPRHSAGKIKMPLMVSYSGLDGKCPPEPVADTMAVVRASNPYPTVVIEQPLHEHDTHPLVLRMQLEFANHIVSKGRELLFPWRAEMLTPYMENFKFTGVHFMPPEYYQSVRAAHLNWQYTLPTLEDEVDFHHVYRGIGLRSRNG